MKKEKTIREWLMTLTEKNYLRAKALNYNRAHNLLTKTPDETVASLKDAVLRGFSWTNTTEGYEFWQDVYINIYKHTYKKPLEDRIATIIAQIFAFRRKRVGWFTFYLFEGSGKRWSIGLVYDESEGYPLFAINLLMVSIEICKPYRRIESELELDELTSEFGV